MEARRLVARPLRPQDRKGHARASTRQRQRQRAAGSGQRAAGAPSTAPMHKPGRARALRNSAANHGCAAQLDVGRGTTGPGLQPARVPPVRAYGQGQSVHPPRLRAVAGTAAIRWRRWSERSVTFNVPGASRSSVASCVDVTGRGWRAAITSSTACWRAVRWLTESRGREVLDGPPEERRRLGEPCDPRSPATHRPLVIRRGSPVTPAA